MATANSYSIDSSAIIHGWHRAYRPKNFSKFWESLEALAEEGRLQMSIEVLNELEKKEDDLFKWCKQLSQHLVIPLDEACQVEVANIMGQFPRLVDTVKGRSGADPFVIALAAIQNPKMIVVTQEDPGKHRIPDVCAAKGIRCIYLADLIEEEDWRF